MPLSKEELEEIIAKAKANNTEKVSPEIIDIEDTIDTSEYEEIEHTCHDNCRHNIPPAVLQVLQKRMKRLENLSKKKKSKR